MPAVFTKAAMLATLMATTVAVNKRDYAAGTSLSAAEEVADLKMSALAAGTGASADLKAQNDTANATAGKPKRASPKPVAETASLPANIKREKDALKALSSTLEKYKARSDAAKGLVDAKEKAEKAKESADKRLADLAAEVTDAKMKRLEAARLEAQTMGEDTSAHVFRGAENTVVAAERKLREANRLARSANAEVKKATGRADRAADRVAQLEEKVDQARHEASTYAEAVKKGQAAYGLQEQRIASAAADLQKTEQSTLSAMDKARKEPKGGAASKPTLKAK